MILRNLPGVMIGCFLGLSACTAAAPDRPQIIADEDLWSFDAASADIVSQSCPEGQQDSFSMSFKLQADPVIPGTDDELGEALSGLNFVGGWALSTPFASFGGLSGLKLMPDGDLLAVSDAGALIEIEFDQEGLAPLGQANMTYLTDRDANILTGKKEADAEGLDYRGGIAFVSFERDHRIEAYGFDVCGAKAHAVLVSRIGDNPSGLGHSIGNNAGPEALALDGGELIFGLETVVNGLGPVGRVARSGAVGFGGEDWIAAHRVPLVGMDVLDGERFSLHRAYNPLTRSNTLYINVRPANGEVQQLAKLNSPLEVDNFEGIAAMSLPNGRVRLFIISDDNFSDNQRTLLYAFETSS
jgi:hypothetical protein